MGNKSNSTQKWNLVMQNCSEANIFALCLEIPACLWLQGSPCARQGPPRMPRGQERKTGNGPSASRMGQTAPRAPCRGLLGCSPPVPPTDLPDLGWSPCCSPVAVGVFWEGRRLKGLKQRSPSLPSPGRIRLSSLSQASGLMPSCTELLPWDRAL